MSSVPTQSTPKELRSKNDPVFILSYDEFLYCRRTIKKGSGDIRDISFGIKKIKKDYVYWLRPTIQRDDTPYDFMRAHNNFSGKVQIPVVDMFECIVTRDVYRRTHGIRPALWITI